MRNRSVVAVFAEMGPGTPQPRVENSARRPYFSDAMRWKRLGIRIAALLTLSGLLYGCFNLLAGPPTLGEALFGFGCAVLLVLTYCDELIFPRSSRSRSASNDRESRR